MENNTPDSFIRQCDGCTVCCEGWLLGEVYGKKFYPGSPCHFKGEKCCSIYEDRPDYPCKKYKCEWLRNPDIPEWMKPNLSKVLITKKYNKEKGNEFLFVKEMGEKIDSTVLNWLFQYFLKKEISILIEVNGWEYYYESNQSKKYFDYT